MPVPTKTDQLAKLRTLTGTSGEIYLAIHALRRSAPGVDVTTQSLAAHSGYPRAVVAACINDLIAHGLIDSVRFVFETGYTKILTRAFSEGWSEEADAAVAGADLRRGAEKLSEVMVALNIAEGIVEVQSDGSVVLDRSAALALAEKIQEMHDLTGAAI